MNFEDFLNTNKTVSKEDEDFFMKIAEEVLGSEAAAEIAGEDATTAINQAANTAANAQTAPTSVTNVPVTNPLTDGASNTAQAIDAVANPQIASAGADLQTIEAASQPKVVQKPQMVAGSGDGSDTKPTDAINKDVESVVNEIAPNADELGKEAAMRGVQMANAFLYTLEKQAADAEYEEAVKLLSETGLLDGYQLTTELNKTASFDEDLAEKALEKIASRQPLTKEEIIAASHAVEDYIADTLEAAENLELEKEAALEEVVYNEELDDMEKIAYAKEVEDSYNNAITNLLVEAGLIEPEEE